ncbi:MAG: pirin family protein [Desulfobulbaceae bacterium]|nr:pirin family protein [Desulfobulbaceae bacterium]
MEHQRVIKRIFKSKSVLEGAGVRLKRAFGYNELPLFDPFLLLDDFRSTRVEHYIKGFPWHPHRGIETITYVLSGELEHGDSMGNTGIISAGDMQWMTAGSGIVHQEMPKGDGEERMEGFQLWANLPASQKMTDPVYRSVNAVEIPELQLENGTTVKVISGRMGEICGPVKNDFIDPGYFDITLEPGTTYKHQTSEGYTVFVYVIAGRGIFGKTKGAHEQEYDNETLLLYKDGNYISVSTAQSGVRFLLISGKPIGEPIAWLGPIVMNTEEELTLAFDEYRKHIFIKYPRGWTKKK